MREVREQLVPVVLVENMRPRGLDEGIHLVVFEKIRNPAKYRYSEIQK
jgi:hypothetical protein